MSMATTDDAAHKTIHSGASSRMVKVRGSDSIFLHWFNVTVWVTMLATGFGIVSGAMVRLVPAAWPEFMQNLFGGNALLASVHAWIGIVWIAVFAFYTVFALPRVLSFLKQVLVLTPKAAFQDMWSMTAALGHLFGIKMTMPEAGRFNGAQRLLGTMIIFGSVGIAASGLYLYFSPKVLDFASNEVFGMIFRWALTLHITLVMLVLVGLVAHIYFALVEERWSLESMKSGMADLDRIKHHNPKWYRELVEKGDI